MIYPFGADIAYKIYATEDGVAFGALPSQTIQAYVFRDQPSRENAISGTGALASPSYSHVSPASTVSFTIPAIDDPDPNIPTQMYYYWIAINFILKTGEQVQTVLRVLPLQRIVGHDQTIGVTATKAKNLYPDLYKYLSEAEVTSMIEMAQVDLINDLKNRGYTWAKINQPEQLYNALLFKVMDYIYSSQVQRQGDKFAFLYDKAMKSYLATIGNLNLSINESNLGSEQATVRTGGLIIGER